MKALYSLLALGALMLPLGAQNPADTVPQAEGDTAFDQIMSEFQERTNEFTSDLEALESQIQDKDITVEDAEKRRKEIVKGYQKDVKRMTKPLASENILKDVLPSESDRKKNKAGGMHFGLTMSSLIEPYELSGMPVAASTPFAHPDFFENRSFEWGLWSQRRLGKSSFWLRRGMNFSSTGLNLGENRIVVVPNAASTTPDLSVEPITGFVEFGESKLRSTYFELPHSLVFNNSHNGEDGLSLSVGMYAGIRLSSVNEVSYTTNYGDVYMESSQNYVVNRWRLGLMAEASYSSLYVNGRVDLSPYFDGAAQNIAAPDVQVMQVAVGLRF